MDFQELNDWSNSFDSFFSNFESLFSRSESRSCARDYIRGLLADVKRKNGWQLAQIMGHNDPQAIQRLLYEAKWDDHLVRHKMRQITVMKLGYEPGVCVIDESGFAKKGNKSAGVQRPWCGRLGKVDNCQVAVFLGYVTPLGNAFLDCKLYLPKKWCEDAERRKNTRIPEETTFHTKPEIALNMLEQAWSEDIPMKWVTGDTAYGNSPWLRNAIDNNNRFYVMDIPSTNTVFLVGESEAISVQDIAQQQPDKAWERMAFEFGEAGMYFDDWTALRVIAPTDEIGVQWLVIRRSVGDKVEHSYALSNAPADTQLSELAAVKLSRHSIEQLLEDAKGEAGLADYEVRHWHSWYRHITLSLLAHTWLSLIRHGQREKKSDAKMDGLQPA